MTKVTVMRNRFVCGYPRHEQGERVHVLELGAALERDYREDAHFATYESPNGRRLTSEFLDQGGVVPITCAVFDVDCAEVHGTDKTVPHSWRMQVREAVQRLAAVHPEPYYYETRGGARVVYRQAEPTVLRSQGDAIEWTKAYSIAVAALARFGIVADPACADWQRLYRLPRATRDRGGKPENWPTWGDPERIGTLLLQATHDDVAVAQSRSKAFGAKRHLTFVSTNGAGQGLLYYLLLARGDVATEHRGGWIARCPNRAQHTNNSDGSNSTLVYPPASGKQLGWVCCKHGHCENLTVRDWLAFFSEAEIEAARVAAGIAKAA